MNDLVILEAGLICPLGGLADFERAWPPAASPPKAIPAEILAGALANLPGLGPNLRRIPRLTRLALAALAPLAPRRDDSSQALVLATAYGSTTATFEFLDSLLRDGPDLASPTAFAHSVTNMAAALLGLHLGLAGPALTVTNFSLTPALEAAAALLTAGGMETVFLGAAAELSPVMAEVEALAGRVVSSPLEGAVFFRLGLATASTPGALRLVLADGPEAETPDMETEETYLGRGPLASAWRLALALRRLKAGSGPELAFPGERFRLAGGEHA
ncbi:MAG: beta-ketoacyl synthase chain length factor [Candidatus Adiutrix sp.]|jgi:hypothetical protein|nr:beta-ketoacyl synthase chain length factor [Candidatus Adiutrix sp.]